MIRGEDLVEERLSLFGFDREAYSCEEWAMLLDDEGERLSEEDLAQARSEAVNDAEAQFQLALL